MNKLEKKIEEIENRVRSEAEVMKVLPLDGHRKYLKKVCSHIKTEGLHCEFGVNRGSTISIISSHIGDSTIYGFDSFEGLPEKWDDENPKGVYSLGGKIPPGPLNKAAQTDPGMYNTEMHAALTGWPENVELVQGMVEATVPKFLSEYKGNFAFAHLDLDIYSATRSVLQNIVSRVQSGTILAFDELLDYPTYREHEIKALAEMLLENEDISYTPLIYQNNGYNYQQVTIKIGKE
tara:strand:+ start:11918 stop:12622 length:705 start_codon:yes stop_codon:yes gene_type:complete